jgi:hypothetical protein
MKKELEQNLAQQWPDWFKIHSNPQKTGMPDGFRVGDGWFTLVLNLCRRIEPLLIQLNASLPKGEHFEVLQVKQKLGTLRFYISHRTDTIDMEIARAEEESSRTCEHCGNPAVLRSGEGKLVTLCDECLRKHGLRQVSRN